MNKIEAGKLDDISAQKYWKIKKIQIIEEYNLLPVKCNFCYTSLVYEKRHNTFCDRICAAKFNNKDRLIKEKMCLTCEKLFKPGQKTSNWCSIVCHHNYIRNFNVLSGQASAKVVKRFLLEKDGFVCSDPECVWDFNKRSVGLEIDHIDGNSTNNILSNLRILCPNCHSLTDSYKAKNKGNGRHKRRQRYQENKSY